MTAVYRMLYTMFRSNTSSHDKPVRSGDRHDTPAFETSPRLHPLKHHPVVVQLAKIGLHALNHGLEKLVFTATTGRSGTKTLARIFAAVPDCRSLHEPWPSMCGGVLQAASFGRTAHTDEIYRCVKSVNILRAAIGHRYYMEANHCFVKTFMGQAIEEFGDRLAVIHLVRPPIPVAMSIYRLRQEPGTGVGNMWWLDYRAPSNLIQVADLLETDRELSHPFYKALWYWHEIEARIAAWRTKVPALKMIRFETDWFNDRAKIMGLLGDLGICCDTPLPATLIGHKDNVREDQKMIAAIPEEQAQSMFARFRDVLAAREVDLSRLEAGRPAC